MRGTIFAAVTAPIAILVLFVPGQGDVQPPAEARDIDRALAQAERDLADAKAKAGRSTI